MNDPYKALGVSHSASQNEIWLAFKTIAERCHPDLNGGNSDRIDELILASEVLALLTDSERKAEYDAKYSAEEMRRKRNDDNFEKENQLKALQKEAIWSLLSGLAYLVLGGGVSFASYMMSSPGGSYFITTGLLLVGAVGAIKGLYGAITISVKIYRIKR